MCAEPMKGQAFHHGNDIGGGSLRFPAFACGLATVKPTPGRIPAYNPSATAERGLLAQLMPVQGAICREVKDVRQATRVMVQRDARDPWWVPAPFDGRRLGLLHRVPRGGQPATRSKARAMSACIG